MANSNLATIKSAIVKAREEHNRHALNKKDFEDQGLTEQAFEQWCEYIKELRTVAVEYVNLTEQIDATDRQIETARRKVWAAWQDVLKQGTDKDFDPHFFIRKEDATKIGHWASFTTIDTAVGRMATNNSLTEFRKRVEILIGIRMAGNEMLDDDKRDLIAAYEGAVRSITNCNNLLDGYKRGDQQVVGLRKRLDGAKAIERKRLEQVKKYGMTEEEAEDFLADIRETIKDLDKQVKDTEKTLKEAIKTRDEKQDDYNNVKAKLRVIGM